VPQISVEDWKMYTEYKGEFTEKHAVVKWFWKIMD